MLPFAAQGAGMAIEDAAVLAKVISDAQPETAVQVAAALKRYARLRRSRIAKVQRTAAKQGGIYHLAGAMALGRDLTIKALGPRRMLARQDWIYRWRS
jgi:salicylate hydroxylase